MSRTAIHIRPMRPCTMFDAIQVITTTNREHDEVARRIALRVAGR